MSDFMYVLSFVSIKRREKTKKVARLPDEVINLKLF